MQDPIQSLDEVEENRLSALKTHNLILRPDPIIDSLQSKTNHEEHKRTNNCEDHNWINNTLAEPTKLSTKTKEDYLQSGPSMSIRTWQDQEGSTEGLPATIRRNRSLDQGEQTAE